MNKLAKILLYNLSLVPLYLLFMIQKFDGSGIECLAEEYDNFGLYEVIIINNLWAIFFLFMMLFSFGIFKKLTTELSSGERLPKEFSSIQNIDFNHLTFIGTYILPLLAFKLDTAKDLIFLLVLLSFIGAIYIKTNLYYLNPIFILFGIRVFSAVDRHGNACVLMSNKKLSSKESLQYTLVGDLYFVKKD